MFPMNRWTEDTLWSELDECEGASAFCVRACSANLDRMRRVGAKLSSRDRVAVWANFLTF